MCCHCQQRPYPSAFGLVVLHSLPWLPSLSEATISVYNLMFFWPCIMNWLYINYELEALIIILFVKYYSPLHVSSIKCSSSGGHNCIQAAFGTVTLCKSSWWPVNTQLEWELTVGGRLLLGVLRHPPTTFPLQSVLTLAAYRKATRTVIESDGTICCLYTTMSCWRWALDARNI